MSTNATLGYGSKLYYCTTSGGIYAEILQTKDLNSPENEVAKVKITNNDSPNNSQEYAAGLMDPGQMEYECVYTKTQQAVLYAFWTAIPSTTVYFKEIFPDGSGWSFAGFITKISNESKTENEAMTGKVTIQQVSASVFAVSTTVS